MRCLVSFFHRFSAGPHARRTPTTSHQGRPRSPTPHVSDLPPTYDVLRGGPHLRTAPPRPSPLPARHRLFAHRRLTTERIFPQHVHSSQVTRNTHLLFCRLDQGRTAHEAVEARRGQVSTSRSRWYLDSSSCLHSTQRFCFLWLFFFLPFVFQYTVGRFHYMKGTEY